MYASNFLRRETSDQAGERFSGRIAAALDIDQTSRMLSFDVGIRTQRMTPPRNTYWKDGQWQKDTTTANLKSNIVERKPVASTPFRVLDAPQLRDDFYCSHLAYCHTKHVLAVALRHRVFLWHETSGVRDFEKNVEISRSVHVTSLSFSSTQGGHGILAIGRSNGQLFLRAVDEQHERFVAEHVHAVACVAFKPLTTRRRSFFTPHPIVQHEDLLVGDETGTVYFYSVEWEPHGRGNTESETAVNDSDPSRSTMNLLAKICIHTQQICGLVWSPEGDLFASGGNDNLCLLFEVRSVLARPAHPVIKTRSVSANIAGEVPNFVPNRRSHHTLRSIMGSGSTDSSQRRSDATEIRHRSTQRSGLPLRVRVRSLARESYFRSDPGILLLGRGRQKYTFTHTAAVKAIAFCPWQRGLLATGGGSNDRAIHFWHAWSGTCLATIAVHAQVTSLIWSSGATGRREICTTLGYAQPEHAYRIAVFSWPDCRQVVGIPWAGGESRALFAVAYPGGPNDRTGKEGQGRGEGGVWSGRTRAEGCVVVASSDKSVKFYEVWSEAKKGGTGGRGGLLGGSSILEGLEGIEVEGEVIR